MIDYADSTDSTDSTTMYNLVMLGDGGVGKSCLTIRYVQNHFMDEYDPTVEDTYRKLVNMEGKLCLLNIVDSAGQDGFSDMKREYMSEGQAFLLIFALDNHKSFEDIKKYRDTIKNVKGVEEVPMVLVGNKCDLRVRSVDTQEAETFAYCNGMPYVDTSAKTGQGVEMAFSLAVREIRKSVNEL